jgi:septum formation protein
MHEASKLFIHAILQASLAPPCSAPGGRPDYAKAESMKLILASSSPYRKELLARLRMPFCAIAPEIDESPLPGELPAALAGRLAMSKGQSVAGRFPQAVVIGADQVATLDGATPIGKPGTLTRARRQLESASGRTMHFFTAFAVLAPGHGAIEHCVPVAVRFRHLGRAEIDRYLALEEPLDCAGAAKCEGLGIALLESIHTDDPTALIGLPLMLLAKALGRIGMPPI